METIWDDLSRDEERLESPAWHENVLKERKKALSAGTVELFDWKEAKERIKRNVSCS